jgi:hypothetical protein
MNLNENFVEPLLKIRLLVGFLGEKRQSNWWDTSFLDPTGTRYVQTTFPRTYLSAGLRSTTEAARILHDLRIGRVGVFHLFRLPVDIEDQVESSINAGAPFVARQTELTKEGALQELREIFQTPLTAPEGPVQIGIPTRILTNDSVSELAAHYHSAFSQGLQCFPYFATISR